MKLPFDLNLSPDWVPALAAHGLDAVHWSTVGDLRATNRGIMEWAAAHGHWVLTHDLDFGAILAATSARAPSVLQLRARDNLPIPRLVALVVAGIRKHSAQLQTGALVSIDEATARVRLLPLGE